MEIIDDPATLALSRRFEAIGENCEMGFALRKVGNEEGQIFRWAVVPIDAIARLIADPPESIYDRDALIPWQHDMLIDREHGIAFHCGSRFAKDPDGNWQSLSSPEEDAAFYEKDAEKFAYMYEKFRARLREVGTIFVYKHIYRPSDESIAALLDAVRSASSGGAGLAVVFQDQSLDEPLRVEFPAHDFALVRMKEIVDNIYAETSPYEHWLEMFRILDKGMPCDYFVAAAASSNG